MTWILVLRLCSVLGITSLLAFGGGNAVIPQFEKLTVCRAVVWMDNIPSREGAEKSWSIRRP